MKQGHCLSLAVCPNIPDLSLLKGRSTSIQIRKKMDCFIVPAKTFVCICVPLFYMLYEGGFLAQGGAECFWHKGAGNDVLQLKKPGPKPIKYFFYGIRNK